ncbi:hypothetical protein FA15DRAFT_683205 [Coprinopsis marcescibilis]|uniref:Integrase core domain-containing protein n=1 Tax=Coprinopsis marcescibilis TaxID=230819 RepID=A0A5C3KFU9_COPMA|nr:hypothetical protein FA15DRAFT_683205 [Coprinopsis marcescibilis]
MSDTGGSNRPGRAVRNVHNVQIERLWVDVTAQVGSSWYNAFIELEIHYDLDINNPSHIWLLQHLFLQNINQHLAFFAESWNHHRIQIRSGPSRSPADMFGFDMLVHGIRGRQLPVDEQEMTEEELEVYGALQSQSAASEGETSWVGQAGPPQNLNEVSVDPPIGPPQLDLQHIFEIELNQQVELLGEANHTIENLWTTALGTAREVFANGF